MTAMELAKRLIEEFCWNEYGDDEEIDFSDLSNVELAYTTITDDEIPVQVSVDLVNFCLNTYLGDKLMNVNRYDSLEHLVQWELYYLDFDNLVAIPDEMLEYYWMKVAGNDH
jgi:hypothetical protein